MSIIVPEPHQAPLRMLVLMDPDRRGRLVAALQSAVPVLHPTSFIPIVVREAATDPIQAYALIEMLTSLLAASRGEPEWFAQEVVEAAKALLGNSDADWARFSADLLAIFRTGGSLDVSAKVAGLRGEYQNVYLAARVLTDIRPVFGPDPTRKPLVGAVVHTLRLTLHQAGSGSRSDLFVAMDSKDVVELKQLLDRAIAKEASLATMIDQAGMKQLGW